MQLFFQPASGYEHVTSLHKPLGYELTLSLIIGRTKNSSLDQLFEPHVDVCYPCPKAPFAEKETFWLRKISPNCVIKDLYQYLPCRLCDNPICANLTVFT